MHTRFSELSSQSRSKLSHLILHWSQADTLDEAVSINSLLPVEMSALTTVAEYAIFYAVLLDDAEMLKDLCAHGANLKVRDRFHSNKTALEVAVNYGRANITRILMKNGAPLPEKINVPSANPCTNPANFFWSLREKHRGREVDYVGVRSVLKRSD